MKLRYQRSTYAVNQGCMYLSTYYWSMAAILRDFVVFVVLDVLRTRPRAIPLTMITLRKSIHRLPFLSYMSMELRLATARPRHLR